VNIRFWGTRGSIAKPGPSTAVFGGNTSCVEVTTTRGTRIVIDCGTGAHGLGQAYPSGDLRRGSLLIGHTHWDHIQGIPFFAPLFVPGNAWDIYAPQGVSSSLHETLAGQMQSTYFPVSLEALGATIRYHDLLEGEFDIDDVHISTRYLNHPALTLAYRLEADGVSMVYACDHEPFSRAAASGEGELSGQDARHAAFARSADILVHDAQYTFAEYPAKVSWGHSTYEYAMLVARTAGVGRLVFTHHDPLRADSEIDELIASARATMHAAGSSIAVDAAREGETIAVEQLAARAPAFGMATTPTVDARASANVSQNVLLGVRSFERADMFEAVLAEHGVRVERTTDANATLEAFARARPGLVVLEHAPDRFDALDVCRSIRSVDRASPVPLPVLVTANREYPGGEQAGVSEWLIPPFTPTYAQAKVQAWMLRGVSRWKKAPLPPDEGRRVAALRALALLDTPAEARFDRIARLAGRIFDAPIVLVSLVDDERQWVKSCIGAPQGIESPRDTSFCAYVVYDRRPLIVGDTLLDDRFAENPVVTGPPHVRFYAGAPITVAGGSILGSFCVADVRPRWFTERDISMLEDLRDLVVAEIEREVA